MIIRSSAVALVRLTLWFTASIVRHTDVGYAASLAWLRGPLTTILMVLLLIARFHDLALGLQVVIEDYVQSAAKLPALLAVRLRCFGLAVAGIVATLRIAFGSQVLQRQDEGPTSAPPLHTVRYEHPTSVVGRKSGRMHV